MREGYEKELARDKAKEAMKPGNPAPEFNTAYNWLKESVHAEKGGSKGAVLFVNHNET